MLPLDAQAGDDFGIKDGQFNGADSVVDEVWGIQVFFRRENYLGVGDWVQRLLHCFFAILLILYVLYYFLVGNPFLISDERSFAE